MKCLVLLLIMVNLILAKQYERCELARELKEIHDVELKEVGMLVCFAELKSGLDTNHEQYGNYGLLSVNIQFIN